MVSIRALTCKGHTRPVVDLAFSDMTDVGSFMISACKDGIPMLRHGNTGDWIGNFEGHKGAVWGVTLNKSASKAATGGADFSAKIWSAETGEELHSFQHKHIVKCVDFSSDGNHLLTGSNEKVLRTFDLCAPEQAPNTFTGHTSNIRSTLYLAGDQQFLSASEDKTVQIWDVRTGESVRTLDFPHSQISVELSRDKAVATISHGKIVSFWDTSNWSEIKQYEVPTQVNSASLHPDQSVFVCGGDDLKVYKFNYETGEELESSKGHFGPVHTVRFSPDGELYASGSEDGTLRLWQTTVGKSYGLWRCIEDEEQADAAGLSEAAAQQAIEAQ